MTRRDATGGPALQRADPAARRTSIVVVTFAAILGVVVISVALERRPELETWIKEDPRERLRLVLGGLAILTSGPAIGLSVYFWRLGRRIVGAERCPPPGFQVTRDTPVIGGGRAIRRGRMVQGLSVVLAAAALVFVVVLWRLGSIL